ncbi:Uncharacterised protein [Collinsella aerofaciens]|nr:Uncharacterised protein [Collinsella aerofaciens]
MAKEQFLCHTRAYRRTATYIFSSYSATLLVLYKCTAGII